ncbi:Protein phosphatase methylesterase 1 [Mortierella claussenii]|nr:Protein phosphatase methylesterase 1 [Mortierella claussenii]
MANDMLRNMYKARLPPLPPHHGDEDDNDADEALNDFSSLAAVHPSKATRFSASSRYAPLDWKDYFEENRLLTVPGENEEEAITFNVYETRGKPKAPVFVTHHGAGLGGLTFALTAKHIKKIVGMGASILAYDCRGHGDTNRMIVPASIEQNQVRELESLQKIVERTAGNLIDIPSTLQIERLQQQVAQNRSNEYVSALNTVKLPQQIIRKLYNMTSVQSSGADLPRGLHDALENGSAAKGVSGSAGGSKPNSGKEQSLTSSGNSIKAPSVREVLAEKTVDSKIVGWMANAMGELHQATESIDVEDVGDLIVTLSPPVA